MDASTGKTLGLILVILLILFIGLRLTPLVLAPLGIFSGISHVIRAPFTSHIDIEPFHFLGLTLASIFSLALFILWIAVIVWVYRDAERRGMNGVLWALLVFIGNLIGLLIYLIIRSDHPLTSKEVCCPPTCPKCQKPLGQNYVFCPHCGERLQPVCPKCAKPIDKAWQVCPQCGEKLS